MKKSSLIITLVFVHLFASLSSQSDLDNHKKYWYYKSRFNNDFILVGNTPTTNTSLVGHGESIPFNERSLDGGLNGNGQPIPYTPSNEMQDGDDPARMGLYLAVLATEYKLLKNNNNQDVSTLKHEIFCALNAINRIDYYAEPAVASGGQPNLNGFFIRGDMPVDFLTGDNYKHFNYYYGHNPIPNNISAPTTGDYGFTQKPFQGNVQGVVHSLGSYTYNNVDINREMSQDETFYLLMGLTLTNKLLDPNETDDGNTFGYGSGETKLATEAQKIAGRIINYMKSDPFWIIRNPVTGNHVHIGYNAMFYAYALDNLGCFIKYGQDMPFWYIPFVTGIGSFPHASCTDYRNPYSYSPAASLAWQGLGASGGGPSADEQGFFNCLAGSSNSVFQARNLLDLNVQAAIQAIQNQINNAINNANQQIQNIINNLPNWVPQWLKNYVQTEISVIENGLAFIVQNLLAAIETAEQYLHPQVLINTTDDRLLYNTISNQVMYHNSCLYPVPQNIPDVPLFHLGSDEYFGIYLRDILHGYNFNLPNWLQWLNNVPAPGHLVVKNEVENILNSAPCEGNSNYGLPNNYPSAFQWGASNFMDRPDPLWKKTTCPTNLGDYSGTDYMLLHNLYYLTEGTSQGVINYIDRTVSTNYPQGNQFTLSNIQTLGSFEHITAYNTVNSNGGAEYRTGKEIALVPTPDHTLGFSAVLGCDFTAHIDPYPCSAISPNEDINRSTPGSTKTDDFCSNEIKPRGTPKKNATESKGPSSEFMNQMQNSLNQQMDSINREIARIAKTVANFNKISVYPNPSTGKFTIEFNLDEGDVLNLEITDIMSVTVLSQRYIAGQMKLSVDLSDYAKGVYFVKCKYLDGREEIRKITIQ